MLPPTSSTLRLWISRTWETVSAAARTRSRSAPAPRGSTWTTTSIPGSALVERVLHAVGGSVPLADRRTRRDADDDVREVLAPGAPQTEPAKLDGRLESRDRLPRDPRVVLGRPVHENVHVPAREAHGGGDHEPRDEERRDRVARGEAERRRDQPGENGERAGEVATEVERVREERVAAVATRAAQRDHRTRGVDREHERDRCERPPRRLDLELDDPGQPQDREHGDEDADRDEEARLGERREVLRLPVPPRVTAVGRADRDRDARRTSAAQRRGPSPSAPPRRAGRGSSSRARRRA